MSALNGTWRSVTEDADAENISVKHVAITLRACRSLEVCSDCDMDNED